MKNRNIIPEEMDSRYTLQQAIINKICSELGLVVWRPDYHADTTDDNTVIIYTKDGHAYNQSHDIAHVDEEKGRVCSLENTDINGNFDLNFMNRGKFNAWVIGFENELKTFVKGQSDKIIMQKQRL